MGFAVEGFQNPKYILAKSNVRILKPECCFFFGVVCFLLGVSENFQSNNRKENGRDRFLKRKRKEGTQKKLI